MDDWYSIEKKVDPNFGGSIWQKLGYEAKLCPVCNAHLHGGICLNACHLSAYTKAAFDLMVAEAARKVNNER